MLVSLKLAVLKLGEPQYVVAARADMSETRLSRILRGRVEATAVERATLCEILGVSEAELFAGELRS